MCGVVKPLRVECGVGWSSHCALNAARCIVVCQVRLSAKRISIRQYGDCPEIRGIMTIGIGPVGYVAGWGFMDGMDTALGWDGDRWSVPEFRRDGDQPA
jgi:hypothetical protein